PQQEIRAAGDVLHRCRIEADFGAEFYAVEGFIAPGDGGAFRAFRMHLAARRPLDAANLEHVPEIRVQFIADADFDRRLRIARQLQLLVVARRGYRYGPLQV